MSDSDASFVPTSTTSVPGPYRRRRRRGRLGGRGPAPYAGARLPLGGRQMYTLTGVDPYATLTLPPGPNRRDAATVMPLLEWTPDRRTGDLIDIDLYVKAARGVRPPLPTDHDPVQWPLDPSWHADMRTAEAEAAGAAVPPLRVTCPTAVGKVSLTRGEVHVAGHVDGMDTLTDQGLGDVVARPDRAAPRPVVGWNDELKEPETLYAVRAVVRRHPARRGDPRLADRTWAVYGPRRPPRAARGNAKQYARVPTLTVHAGRVAKVRANTGQILVPGDVERVALVAARCVRMQLCHNKGPPVPPGHVPAPRRARTKVRAAVPEVPPSPPLVPIPLELQAPLRYEAEALAEPELDPWRVDLYDTNQGIRI